MYQLQPPRPEFASPGPKRARTAGAKGEGDWTCPNCGNINFAFRETCNMRKCGAPKPADFSRGNLVAAPLYEQQPFPPSYGGPGAPTPAVAYITPSSYIGQQQVVAAPQPPATYTTIPQTYGAIPSAYGSAPTTYTPAYTVTPQGTYIPQLTSGPVYPAGITYGLAPPPEAPYRGPTMRGAAPPFSPPEDGGRKRRAGPDGDCDWICPKCGNTNFAFRTVCNMRKCGEPKPVVGPGGPYPGQVEIPRPPMGSGPGFSGSMGGAPARPPAPQGPPPEGSWSCATCGNLNYPFRTHCNRRNCGAERPPTAPTATMVPPV